MVTNYYTKLCEAIKVRSKNTDTVVKELGKLFATFNIPNEIVSNNVPFNSIEFKNFCVINDNKDACISPKYSQSNGLVDSQQVFLKVYLEKYNIIKINYGIVYQSIEIVQLRKLIYLQLIYYIIVD